MLSNGLINILLNTLQKFTINQTWGQFNSGIEIDGQFQFRNWNWNCFFFFKGNWNWN